MTNRQKQLRGTAVRDKLVDVAADLFYTNGIHAVGIDEVVRQSGIAKASLYRWFPSKDDLVLAVLQRRDDLFWAQWARTADQYPGALQQLRAQIAWIQDLATTVGYRGCAFVNTAAEFEYSHTTIRQRCQQHEDRLAEELQRLTAQLDRTDSRDLAEQMHVAIVGAFAVAGLYPTGGPARLLTTITDTLIDTVTKPPPQPSH